MAGGGQMLWKCCFDFWKSEGVLGAQRSAAIESGACRSFKSRFCGNLENFEYLDLVAKGLRCSFSERDRNFVSLITFDSFGMAVLVAILASQRFGTN